jgi:glycosyltransferase involved in cell wall biosynthesis
MSGLPESAPVIGVVIPTYNCAGQIPAALESLRRQTWPHLRIIVVDDGSTDGTEALLAPLAARGELVYLRLANGGPSRARNHGIRAAECPLIAFLDADDTLDPDALRPMAEALAASPRAAFAIGDVLRVYPDRSELRLGSPPPGSPWRAILERNFVEGGGVFRREALLEVGLFDESYRAFEDWDLYIRLIARGLEPVYVPGPSYNYILRGDSITRDERVLVASYERLVRQHHAPLARKGDRVFRRIYAVHLWKIARTYFYKLRMPLKALQCVVEALLNDPVPQRLRRRQLAAQAAANRP